MKKINTVNISENVRRQPFNKASYDHIQEAFQEVFNHIMKGLLDDLTLIKILHGIVDSDPSVTAWDLSAGAIYYNGEIFTVDAFIGSHATQVPVLSLETTYAAGDPVTFSDGNQFNVHEIRKLKWTMGVSGSGISDFHVLIHRLSDHINILVDKTKVSTTVFAGERYGIVGDLNDHQPGNIQVVTGDAPNAPLAGSANIFKVITAKHTTNGSRCQTAIQIGGAASGDIHVRVQPFGGGFGAWSNVNT